MGMRMYLYSEKKREILWWVCVDVFDDVLPAVLNMMVITTQEPENFSQMIVLKASAIAVRTSNESHQRRPPPPPNQIESAPQFLWPSLFIFFRLFFVWYCSVRYLASW